MMTSAEMNKILKQINEAFDKVNVRVNVLEAEIVKLKEVKPEKAKTSKKT